MPGVIVVDPRKCPKCNKRGPDGTDFDCPLCNGRFCSGCFKYILEGDGNQIKCPHCYIVLDLPPHEQTQSGS